ACANNAESAQLAALHGPQCAAARLGDPSLEEGVPRRREVQAVVARDFGERNRLQIDQRRVRRGGRADALEAKIPVGELETATGVKTLHVEDAVHADGGRRLQTRQQQVAAMPPQALAQSSAAQIRPDNEEAHETETA